MFSVDQMSSSCMTKHPAGRPLPHKKCLPQTAPCDLFKRSEWPGASPDLNACEHLGSVLKEKVAVKMVSERGGSKACMTRLKKHIAATLKELEYDTELFQALLTSYPRRIEGVKDAEGGHTDY